MDQIFGQSRYGVVDNGIFGTRIIAGIVTGMRYTEDKPVYELRFGKDSWWTSEIAKTKEELMDIIDLASLDRIKETHGLKLKYDK